MRAVVIGGGIVGLSCGYFLAREGVAVTVVDRAQFGAGASHGNAGFVSPSLVAPIPGPGAIKLGLRSMYRPGAAIALRPTVSPARLLWLAAFAGHCTARRQRRGLHATARFAQRAIPAYDVLARDGIEFTMHDTSLLFVSPDERSASAFGDELMEIRAYGYPDPELLDGDALRRLEPSLGEGARAGYAVPGERFVEPSTVTGGLVTALESLGADLRPDCAVTALDQGDASITVGAGGERLVADVVVIAAGADSGSVAALAGVRVPVVGGKGHSLSVALDPLPRQPVCLIDHHIACTPLNGRLRITGGMELGRTKPRLDPNVLTQIVADAQPYFLPFAEGDRSDGWTGMRPMTPSGLPLIGPVRARPGLYLATGHSTLGVTLGPATGELLTRQIIDGRPDPVLHAFSP